MTERSILKAVNNPFNDNPFSESSFSCVNSPKKMKKIITLKKRKTVDPYDEDVRLTITLL